VAVLGGGQLGRMLGLAAIPLGVAFRFLDPSPDAPAAAVGELVVGGLDDEAALDEVARGADVVTYEWEGVPATSARHLAAHGMPVRPGDRSLEVSQDRLVEKDTFRALGVGTPEYRAVSSRPDLDTAVDAIGLPAVLKTRRGGYDGKGQAVLRAPSDLDAAWTSLGDVPLILEAFVPFDRELSIVGVRGVDGAIACWRVVENEHRDGILHLTRAPAPSSEALTARAQEIASELLLALDHVGVLAIELFDVEGDLLANEVAPRVHNSGHWTIEGAMTSQFENHVRAVLGLPLGDTSARGTAAMLNCVGAMPDAGAVLTVPGAHLHDYGKAARPGRKLGHITVVADSPADLDARLARLLPLVDR